MKPTADDDQILTGTDAIDRMVDTWQDMGLGKVDAEVHGPWLIIRRGGGDYSTFVSLVDDTVVTILDSTATTRHVPEEYRPTADLSNADVLKLERAFDGAGGGMYPTNEGETFAIAFKDDDGYKELHVSLLDASIDVAET